MMSLNRVDIDGLSASVIKGQSVEQLSLGRRIASYVRASMRVYRNAGVEQGGEGPQQGEAQMGQALHQQVMGNNSITL